MNQTQTQISRQALSPISGRVIKMNKLALIFTFLLCLSGCIAQAPEVKLDDGTDPYAKDYQGSFAIPKLRNVDYELSPAQSSYKVGDVVQVNAWVYNRNLVKLPNETVSISFSPADAVESTSEGYLFKSFGEVQLSACHTYEGEKYCTSRVISVTNGGPKITITDPQENIVLSATDMINAYGVEGPENPRFTLKGFVSNTQTANLAVNGAEASVNDDGSFEAEVPLQPGFNLITVSAFDGISTEPTKKYLSAVYAFDYEQPILMSPSKVTNNENENGENENGENENKSSEEYYAFEAPSAYNVRIGRNFFDDGKDPSEGPGGLYYAEDIADNLNLIVGSINILDSISNPVFQNSILEFSILGYEIDKPKASVEVENDYIVITLRIPRLKFETSGTFKVTEASPTTSDLSGSIELGCSVTAKMYIDLLHPKHPFSFGLDDQGKVLAPPLFTIESVTSEFKDEETNSLFSAAKSALRTSIEGTVQQILNDRLLTRIPEFLSEMYLDIRDNLTSRTNPFSFASNPAGNLTIRADVASFSVSKNVGLDVKFSSSSTMQSTQIKSFRGLPILFRPQSSFKDSYFDGPRIQLGLNFTYLNSTLYAVWAGKALETEYSLRTNDFPTNEMGFSEVEAIKFSPNIPPIVRPARMNEPHHAVIEFGDTDITLVANGTEYRHKLYAKLDVIYDIVDNKIVLRFSGKEPEVILYKDDEANFAMPITSYQLKTFLVGKLIEDISSILISTLSVDLPLPNFDAIASLVSGKLEAKERAYLKSNPVTLRDGYMWLYFDLVSGFDIKE